MYIITKQNIMNYLFSRKHLLEPCRQKQVQAQLFGISGHMSLGYCCVLGHVFNAIDLVGGFRVGLP
jgi:hypothetical protein